MVHIVGEEGAVVEEGGHACFGNIGSICAVDSSVVSAAISRVADGVSRAGRSVDCSLCLEEAFDFVTEEQVVG